MTLRGKSSSTLIVLIVLTTSCGVVSAQDPAAKARELKAKAQEAAAAQAKAAQVAKEVAAKEAAAREAAAKEAQVKKEAGSRTTVASKDAVPLDLTKFVGIKPESYEKIKQYPWAATPVGKHTFAGVPLESQGATILWGKRNADRGQNYPKTITDIPVQKKFETLYILHCVFFEAAKGDPSFSTVLNYEDGKMQSDEVLCGEDSKDWWVNDPNEKRGPTSKRSTLAWSGIGKANDRDQEVRFCLTAIENKHPERLVTTIDLVSSEKQAAGVILAITVGKSGLLKPQPDKPAEPKLSEPKPSEPKEDK